MIYWNMVNPEPAVAGCHLRRRQWLESLFAWYHGTLVPWYIGTNYRPILAMPKTRPPVPIPVERIQTGVRLEKRLLKVLKALAEHKDLTLGDLLEGIVLHAFEGRPAFSSDTLALIAQFKQIYGLDLTADASHQLSDRKGA